MKTNGIYLLFVFTLLLVLAAQQGFAQKEYIIGEHKAPVTKPDPASSYVGSDKCRMCHSEEYDGWKTSGHPYKLNTPAEAQAFTSPAIPAPDGYTYDDIYLVIGGWGWKARFMDKNGYIITRTGPNKTIPGLNQFNLATQTWLDYSPGQENKKFDCGNCHTTGYSLAGSQENKPGIVGTWEEKSIGCEVCHGPGSIHVARGGGKGVAIINNDSAALCGNCHTRGPDDTKIMASDGYIQHHEQYPELLNSPHKDLTCVSCHDPHRGTRKGQTNPTQGAGIKAQCAACHSQQSMNFTGSTMQIAGVTCLDCHMPMATKSAGITAAPFKADTKTHLFTINPDPNARMFTDDGKFANGYLTLDFACLSCHPNQTKEWAAAYATPGIHAFVKAPEETPGFGLLAAVVAFFLLAFLARRR